MFSNEAEAKGTANLRERRGKRRERKRKREIDFRAGICWVDWQLETEEGFLRYSCAELFFFGKSQCLHLYPSVIRWDSSLLLRGMSFS